MGIQRKTLFGFPVPQRPASVNTSREVPLTQGMDLSQPWPLRAPGSAISMTNHLPLDGALIPRSRLSSLNTLRTLSAIWGLAERTDANALTPEIWASGGTRHGYVTSNGSISLASFVSSFGLGTAPTLGSSGWLYTQAFFGGIGSTGNNALIAAGNSQDTVVVLWRDASAAAAPLFSYLTSAPRAKAVTSYNNYVIAWNVAPAGVANVTRAQWCVRGSPSNWTGEGSGFEDLLAMRGSGTVAYGLPDSRFLLFSDLETWYGIDAAYPSQFVFAPLDPKIGCPYPLTLQWCDRGLLFVGSDGAVRLIPREGGPSQVVSASMAKLFRRSTPNNAIVSWAMYDATTRIYHLSVGDSATTGNQRSYVLNIDTGAWGLADYGVTNANRGLAVYQPVLKSHTGNEGIYFGSSNGTVYSTSSLLAQDTPGSVVTAVWQSGPIATDLAGNYKQLTKIALDYRATSKSTVTCKISQDGGNNYEATGALMSLTSAPVAGRVELDVYRGGAFPAIELTSTSTGYEFHRMDVAMNLGGRK